MLINRQFNCVSCGSPMSTQLIRCPGCFFDYGHLVNPTDPEAIEKKEKHEELVLHGTLSLGTGPGKFNASFDYNGVSSLDKLVRFTVAFGHRTQISSGPGRTPSDVILSYVPEVIGSGISNFAAGPQSCSGICIISPTSPTWGHLFPAMDSWVQNKSPQTTWMCATCSNAVQFGQAFCPECYVKHGSDWRTFMV
jgi:hypothetical protein